MNLHMRAAIITAALFVVRTKCDQTSLYFSLLVANSTSFNTASLLSVIDKTLVLVNDDPTILQGYYLQYGTALQHEVVYP